MRRLLNSDALGIKGESRFAELCADASLHANKVGNDRTGWDFHVEYPLAGNENSSRLDSRPQPPEFRVQVKTVWMDATHVKLRLSSAERLAKWPGPTFIVVLVVDDRTLSFVSMHVLHVREEVLSKTLKALRECERNNKTRVNHTFIRFNHRRDGKALNPSGAALSDHVLASIGSDASRYASEKQEERANLGVKGARHSISMTLDASSESEASDIMLGLKKGRFSKLVVEETRWGITLPDKDAQGPGEVSIRPKPHRAQLTFRQGVNAVSEQVEVFLAADFHLRPYARKIRIVGVGFEILINQGDGQLSLEFKEYSANGISIVTWKSLIKAQLILLSGGELCLRTNGPAALDLKPAFNGFDTTLDRLRNTAELLNKLSVVIEAAGDATVRMNGDDLNAAWSHIEFLHEILTAPAAAHLGPFQITSASTLPAELQILDGLVVGRFLLRERQMAWCAATLVEFADRAEDTIEVAAGELSLKRVEVIEEGEEAFDQFKKLAQDETRVRIVLDVGDMTGS